MIDKADPEDEKSRIARLKDNYENFFKGTYYLFVGHGAGLVGCFAALRDYAATPQLKGIGTLIELFGNGLLAAMITYACLLVARMEVFAAIGNRRVACARFG